MNTKAIEFQMGRNSQRGVVHVADLHRPAKSTLPGARANSRKVPGVRRHGNCTRPSTGRTGRALPPRRMMVFEREKKHADPLRRWKSAGRHSAEPAGQSDASGGEGSG